MIPSFADLNMLTQKYLQGYIDVENFTYGIISDFGCTSLVIVSEDAFRNFAINLQNNKDDMKQNYASALNSETGAEINDRIAHCASFLQKEGAGLQFIFNLYDEMIQNWTGWKAKTLNEKNKLEDLNCNK